MHFGTYATIWNPANKTLRRDILRNVADTKFGIDRTGKNHNNYVQYHIKKEWDKLDKDGNPTEIIRENKEDIRHKANKWELDSISK